MGRVFGWVWVLLGIRIRGSRVGLRGIGGGRGITEGLVSEWLVRILGIRLFFRVFLFLLIVNGF